MKIMYFKFGYPVYSYFVFSVGHPGSRAYPGPVRAFPVPGWWHRAMIDCDAVLAPKTFTLKQKLSERPETANHAAGMTDQKS